MGKSKVLLALVLCVASIVSISNVHGTVYLMDDFENGVIDPALWQTILPYSQSSLVEQNGYLTTTGRGTLGTQNSFSGGIVVSGDFVLLHPWEHFKIALRTDFSTFGSYAELTGLVVGFTADQSTIRIDRFSSSGVLLFESQPFSFALGQSYHFAITDTGSSIAVALNGNPFLNVTSSFSTGERVAFYSREFSATATRLDNVTISAVPEPHPATLLLASLSLRIVLRRTKRNFALG